VIRIKNQEDSLIFLFFEFFIIEIEETAAFAEAPDIRKAIYKEH